LIAITDSYQSFSAHQVERLTLAINESTNIKVLPRK